jgi:hypothetical protein
MGGDFVKRLATQEQSPLSFLRSYLGVEDKRRLRGEGSRRLMAKKFDSLALEIVETVSFFVWREGISDLWNIVNKTSDEGYLFSCHESVLLQTEISRANKKVMGGSSLATKRRKEEIMREAARELARAGDLGSACECLIGANEWMEALALAPAVSLKFWQSLLDRFNDLASEDIEERASFLVAGKRTGSLAREYLAKNEPRKAAIALVAGEKDEKLKREIVTSLAQGYAEEGGSSVKTAACLISFDGREKEALKELESCGLAEVVERLLLLIKQ